LLPERLWPVLHTDPIVLDAFTHLLGCWGIDKKAGEEGDVIFPLRLARLTIHGEDPPEGASVECRIRVRRITRYRVMVDAELVADDGRVWVSLEGWEDWRFYWPARYRDVFRQPDRVLVGEPLDLTPAGLADPATLSAVWLEPPADMGKPVWRDVLEWVQLASEERASGTDEASRTRRTWGRLAAKEAARRLWLARGREPVYPADLVIEEETDGLGRVRSLLGSTDGDGPTVSIATTDGVALAAACDAPGMRVGLAVRRVVPSEGQGVESVPGGPEIGPVPGLSGSSLAGGEWSTRIDCAKEAMARALGLGRSGLAELVVDRVEPESGAVMLRRPGGERKGRPADLLQCVTAARGEYVWALALEKGDSHASP
jgi:hypothetical protein